MSTTDDSNEATPAETLVGSGAEVESVEEEFHPFDDLTEGYSPSVIRKVLGDDGLPTQAVAASDEDITVLSKETLVCLGDFTAFYQLQMQKWLTPEEVEQDMYGNWHMIAEPRLEVRPLRPPCEHYVRQVTQLENNPQHKAHIRLCSARRSMSGAFMSLTDTAMWACSMRSPRDLVSERKYIDSFDEKKIQQGQEREFTSIFGKV